jgi:glycosyltransferase involved in cell wall biosynthesis
MQEAPGLRILQIGPTVDRGGVSVAIADLCLGLSRMGHQVGLFCNGGAVLKRLEGSGVGIFLSETISGTKALLARVVRTAQVLRAFRPNIVHVHGRGPALASALAGRYPDFFTLHSASLADRVTHFDTGLVRRIFSPLGRTIIVLNDAAGAFCRTELKINPMRIVQVPNGVDTDRFVPADPDSREDRRADLGINPGEFLVLFVGRFQPEKQPLAVVRLAEAVRSRGNERVRFAMVGNGELKAETEAMVSELGLADRVLLFKHQDPLPFYQAADLLVMPSLYEGFGLVMLEAMAAGCPVLRTRTGGFAEVIEEGKTGYGCDPIVDDFVAKGLAVLDDPEDLARVAAEGRRKVLSDLSLAAQSEAMTDAYRAALSDRGRA